MCLTGASWEKKKHIFQGNHLEGDGLHLNVKVPVGEF